VVKKKGSHLAGKPPRKGRNEAIAQRAQSKFKGRKVNLKEPKFYSIILTILAGFSSLCGLCERDLMKPPCKGRKEVFRYKLPGWERAPMSQLAVMAFIYAGFGLAISFACRCCVNRLRRFTSEFCHRTKGSRQNSLAVL
jgi:hypothetical protein